jgi:hypothetical protein
MDFGMIGGIVGLIGAGLQASNQAAQIEEEYAALNWQKQRAVQQDWFAQAGRQDAFGNVTKYNPATNMWEVHLTGEQQNIQDAQQREQLLQLTQDAPAARKMRQALQQRAQEAEQPYKKAALGYQYDLPPTVPALQSQLTTLMATNDMLKSKADQALIMRSALRMGQGANPAEIIKAVSDQLGASDVTNNRLLQARKQAIGEETQLQQQHETQYGKPMSVWANIMQQGGNLPSGPSTTSTINQALNSAITGQQSGMTNAFNAGTTGVSNAMQALAKAMGQSPDLSKVAELFAKMKFGGAGTGGTEDPTGDSGVSSFGQSSYTNDPGYGASDESDF